MDLTLLLLPYDILLNLVLKTTMIYIYKAEWVVSWVVLQVMTVKLFCQFACDRF